MCEGSPSVARNGRVSVPVARLVGKHIGGDLQARSKGKSMCGAKRGGRSVAVGEGRKRYALRSGASQDVVPSSPSTSIPFDPLAGCEEEDASRVAPTGLVEGCRNKANSFHVCSDFCRKLASSENPKSTCPSVDFGTFLDGATSSPLASLPLDPLAVCIAGDSSGATTIGSVEVCKNRENPFHVCSDFCRKLASSENSKMTCSPFASAPPPNKDNGSKSGGDRFSFGDSVVFFSDEPVDFCISDGSIDAIAAD